MLWNGLRFPQGSLNQIHVKGDMLQLPESNPRRSGVLNLHSSTFFSYTKEKDVLVNLMIHPYKIHNINEHVFYPKHSGTFQVI